MSEGDSARPWTAAMVEARLIEAFALDRRLPDLGPCRWEPCAMSDRDARRAMSDLLDDVEKHDGDGDRDPWLATLDQSKDDDLEWVFAEGFRVFMTGIRRAAAAHKRAAQDELVSLVRAACEEIRDNPGLFAIMCRRAERSITRAEVRRRERERMYESLEWLITPEQVDELDSARKVTLAWLRSGLPKDDFSPTMGMLPLDLRRAVRRYCEAVAGRLGNLSAEPSPTLDSRPNLVFGLDNIAAELARSPRTTARMVEAGRLPVGEFFGELCGDRRMLRSFRETHRDRQFTAALYAAA